MKFKEIEKAYQKIEKKVRSNKWMAKVEKIFKDAQNSRKKQSKKFRDKYWVQKLQDRLRKAEIDIFRFREKLHTDKRFCVAILSIMAFHTFV